MSIKISKITRSGRSTRSTGCMKENRSGVTSRINKAKVSLVSKVRI